MARFVTPNDHDATLRGNTADEDTIQHLSTRMMADVAAQSLPTELRELALQLAAALRAHADDADDKADETGPAGGRGF